MRKSGLLLALLTTTTSNRRTSLCGHLCRRRRSFGSSVGSIDEVGTTTDSMTNASIKMRKSAAIANAAIACNRVGKREPRRLFLSKATFAGDGSGDEFCIAIVEEANHGLVVGAPEVASIIKRARTKSATMIAAATTTQTANSANRLNIAGAHCLSTDSMPATGRQNKRSRHAAFTTAGTRSRV